MTKSKGADCAGISFEVPIKVADAVDIMEWVESLMKPPGEAISEMANPIELPIVSLVQGDRKQMTIVGDRVESLASAPPEREVQVVVWKCYGCQSSGWISWLDIEAKASLFINMIAGFGAVQCHDIVCGHKAIFLNGYENGDPVDELANLDRWMRDNNLEPKM